MLRCFSLPPPLPHAPAPTEIWRCTCMLMRCCMSSVTLMILIHFPVVPPKLSNV